MWCKVGDDPYGSDAVHGGVARVFIGSKYKREDIIRINPKQLAWFIQVMKLFFLDMTFKDGGPCEHKIAREEMEESIKTNPELLTRFDIILHQNDINLNSNDPWDDGVPL